MDRMYLDHAATTPIHPEVAKTMVNVMESMFGNPSSIHSFGRETRGILDSARETLAANIGAKPNSIIFTSGGTEADNLALIGYAESSRDKGLHIITTSIEHHAVLHSCEELEKRGFEVTYLGVDKQGLILLDELKKALRDDTILVSVMYGNNEVGTLQPIMEIGELLSGHQAALHTDAVQAYGVEELNVDDLRVDMMSVSAHKINGPKGIGFLYVRNGIKLAQRAFGGDQERKRRAGTENVPAIAGFEKAVQISAETQKTRREEYKQYKEAFMNVLDSFDIHYEQNGLLDLSLPHILNLSFPGTNVEALLVNLDLAGIAASSGSACTAGSIEPSHVLVAMFGEGSDRLANAVRFSFGLNNSLEQIKKAAEETAAIVLRLTSR
ncbi:cysteine desulfurase family protein [Mesobacillus zeae]|uniref:cysteine desulfurase n=1 Tax=Mesobacillus zeae TaxID=1917180 RepID=A0A398B7Q5_9BACI|nr:cysteine desulfurase family protein [Mesobacillus zeae]RID83743.1 cysteine desulfurase [Mesobacillus zeae]